MPGSRADIALPIVQVESLMRKKEPSQPCSFAVPSQSLGVSEKKPELVLLSFARHILPHVLTLLILTVPFQAFSQTHNGIHWPAVAALPPATAISSVSTVPTSPLTLNNPQSLAVDALGNLFIADTSNSRIVR